MADASRRHNCPEQSFYRWEARSGGMDVSEARWLRALWHENAEPNKMVAVQAPVSGQQESDD
jgi:putative transposase